MSGAHHNPMDQFKIKKIFDLNIFGLDVSFTNSSLVALIILGVFGTFFLLATRKKSIVPSKSQLLCEGAYGFIVKLVGENIPHTGLKYVPIVFSVFTFILCSNIFGMIPYTFTITSHIATTLIIAIFVFFSVVIIGVCNQGPAYFLHFCPKGVPLFVAPLVFVVELFSFLVRPFVLALRLAANMTAGHTVLKVIAGFVAPMAIFGVVPLVFLSVLTAFELFIAFLQAYIFSLLSCNYINEALASH